LSIELVTVEVSDNTVEVSPRIEETFMINLVGDNATPSEELDLIRLEIDPMGLNLESEINESSLLIETNPLATPSVEILGL
jgi:hypothetical protein